MGVARSSGGREFAFRQSSAAPGSPNFSLCLQKIVKRFSRQRLPGFERSARSPYYLSRVIHVVPFREQVMGESFYLKLLGFPELRRPDGRPVKLKVRKHLALLIYLVMDADVVHLRDELVDLFWPEVPTSNGRHSLSMAFSVLRGIFGVDCVRGNHAGVEFVAPGLTLDLDRLKAYQILGTGTIPPLDIEGFLQGFHLEGAPAFQHWRDRRQAHLLPMIQAGLLMLTDEARRGGDTPRMMALADRLLTLDPLTEEGIRARMEAFAMQGDRVSALRVFESWKRQLAEDLGAVPSEILEAMATRLRRRGATPPVESGANTPVASTESWAERCFVGRTSEFRVLFEAWESTTQLNTRHILLNGDTGVGKSTLAMRFASAAALEGAAVARVQCFELEQRIAFGMIGALVTSLLDRPAVSGTAPESLAEVARIVPALRERFPHLPASRRTEGEAARLHFAEGTFALFEAIMEDQPLILIVDDYPRSDEASLSVLHMLLRRAENERLMVVLSGRPPEPGEPPQATRIRKGVSYLPLWRIDLEPLSDLESDELLSVLLARAARKPGSPQRRAILQTSGGNPMALELLTQDWITHGEDALAVSLPAMRADVPGSAQEAIGYDRLIERMLPSLPPRTRLALYLAAILGPRLNDLGCFDTVEFTPVQTMAALSDLVERRVLRNTEKGLEFVNELIRARLYLKIPTASRIRLHDGVATRLLSAVAGGEAIPGLEIAWHCIRARRREEATPFLMHGARTAITHGAPDEAARALSSAMGHLRGKAKAEAALLLAETYQEMADWKAALECIENIDSSYRDEPQLHEMAAILEIECRRQLGEYPPDAFDGVLEDLIQKAQGGHNPVSRVRAALAAVQGASTVRNQKVLTLAYEAIRGLPLYELSAPDTAKALLSKAMAHYHLRQPQAGLSEVREAAHLLEQAGATDTTFVTIQIGLGAYACITGTYGDGLLPLERAYQAAERLDNSPLMSQAAVNLALCYYRLGKTEDHFRWSITARHKSLSTGPGSYDRISSLWLYALACFERGEGRKVEETLQALERERQSIRVLWIRQSALLHEAEVSWLRGDKQLALTRASEVYQSRKDGLCHGFEGRIARWIAVGATHSSTPPAAARLMRNWYRRVDRLDALDQAEVLCSLTRLGELGESVPADVVDRARVALARLPIACSKQLRRFGLRLPH